MSDPNRSIWSEKRTWQGAGIWTLILAVNFAVWGVGIYFLIWVLD